MVVDRHGLVSLVVGIHVLVAVVVGVVDVVDVVTLALFVNFLLLFPAVEEDLEDAEGAEDANEAIDNHCDDQHHVDPVDALLGTVVVVPVIREVVSAPVCFPVASEGIDD